LEKAGPSSASKYDEKQFTDSDDSEDNDTIEKEAENQPLRMDFTSALELKMDQFLIVSFIDDKTSKKLKKFVSKILELSKKKKKDYSILFKKLQGEKQCVCAP
jgi:hypothetical protein